MKQSLRQSLVSHAIRRGIKPQIGCRDKRKRVELFGTVKELLKQCRKAPPRLLAGERDTVFPTGIYLMRVRVGVTGTVS